MPSWQPSTKNRPSIMTVAPRSRTSPSVAPATPVFYTVAPPLGRCRRLGGGGFGQMQVGDLVLGLAFRAALDV
jgi:hypothetical protein